MNCKNWLKTHGPITPATVYEAGKKEGFSRKDIKSARHWHGVHIDTQVNGGTTLWRWNP